MSTTVLQARNLTKRYGRLTAVQDLSLDVFEGEVLGLLGPNGAGPGEVAYELSALVILSLLYFVAGAWLFQRLHLHAA